MAPRARGKTKSHPILGFLPLSVVRSSARGDGLCHLRFFYPGLLEDITVARRAIPHNTIKIMTDLETYVAFALASAVLAPVLERYPRTFLLSRLAVRLNGIEYGSDLSSEWMDALVPLLETLDHRGIPVIYCDGFELRVPGMSSVLVDLKDHSPADFLPLFVEDTPLLDPNAFLFLPLGSSLRNVLSVVDRSKTKSDFERLLLARGGAIYRWVESWFEILLGRDDFVRLGYDRLPVRELTHQPRAT